MIGEGIQSTNQRRHSFVDDRVEVGFFTDPSVCIGCKACEVACKEWNEVPDDGFTWTGNSYDNTGHLGASTWRHVLFVEQNRSKGNQIAGPMSLGGEEEDPFRWIFLSDVCKHCENAGCLEACPTGSIVRTEIGSVLVQNDVCNGCGYCVVACPFGVIDRRPAPASRCRRRVQMHLLLRPAKKRAHAGLRESLPDGIHCLRPVWTTFARAVRDGFGPCKRAATATRDCMIRRKRPSVESTRFSSSSASQKPMAFRRNRRSRPFT